jgi:hypothetical protein
LSYEAEADGLVAERVVTAVLDAVETP